MILLYSFIYDNERCKKCLNKSFVNKDFEQRNNLFIYLSIYYLPLYLPILNGLLYNGGIL